MDVFRTEQFWFSLLRDDSPRELWRPELEVIFLLQGTGRIYSPGLNAACALREADIFVVNSFKVQEFELDAGSAALSFSVSPQFINNVAPELLTHQVNCRSFLYADEEQSAFHALRQDLARAFQMFYKRENDGTAYAKSGAAAILEDLGRYFLDRNQRVEYSGAQESLQKITQYVQHNYRQRITLDELVKYTFLSKTYISRIFTRYLGISFTGYLELLRLSSATQLIAGQGTLEQIAQASGFPNVDAMTLAFKRHWGVTPGEYRRTFAQRGNPPIGAVPRRRATSFLPPCCTMPGRRRRRAHRWRVCAS